ncbi:Mov34/MPN/PAD-1 family protein [Neobacillus sp. D3-1R]|uniref:Mov34/MPN/PAD-1 family protein n=1 Tax=Neobacillus sp. D3-1R TaxID=3445778 RepID=UPI003FA03DBA
MLYIYDDVLELIKKEIGDHEPERGGALLGEPGELVVTRFIFDPSAETTSSSYSPSRELNLMVKKAEELEGLEFKGIIHSHPGRLDHPSQQDLLELETGLEINPHMPYYLLPIVTGEYEGDLEAHELVLGGMKISFYAGVLDEDSGVRVKTMDVNLVPFGLFQKELESLCRVIPGLRNPEVYKVNHDGQPLLAGKIEIEELFDLLLLVDVNYPSCQTSILVTHIDGEQEECFMESAVELEKFVLEMIERCTETFQ